MTSPNKRVRFTKNEVNAPKTTPAMLVLSPKGAAQAAVRAYAASLSHTLSPIILTAGEHFVDRVHKLITKGTQFNKMTDDDDFIPRSARLVNFNFRVCKEVEVNPDFAVIQEDTANLVNYFKKELKFKIMATLKIEVSILKKRLYDNLAKDMDRVVVASLTANGKDPAQAHEIISSILHFHSDEFLSNTDVELDEFYEIYKQVHALDVFPISPLPSQDDMNDLTENADGTLVPHSVVTPPRLRMPNYMRPNMVNAATRAEQVQQSIALPYKTALFNTFTNPMKVYFERREQVIIDNTLRRFHEESTLTDSTAETEARLGLEETASPELVEDLVRRLTSEHAAAAKAEIGQLKKQISDLKSSKKERAPRQKAQKKTPKQSQADPKADARGKGRSKQKSTKKQDSKKKKKTKNKPASKTKRN